MTARLVSRQLPRPLAGGRAGGRWLLLSGGTLCSPGTPRIPVARSPPPGR